MYVRREIFVEGQGGEPSSFGVQGGTKTLKGSAKIGGAVNIAGPPTPESGEAMAPPAPPVPTPMVTSNYNYPVPRNTQHNRSRRNSAFTDAQTRLAHSAHRWQQNRQKFLWDRLQIDARQ